MGQQKLGSDENNVIGETLSVGACGHLAAMILELQQMALRLGAANVSSHLQMAYVETQMLRRQHHSQHQAQ